MQITRLNESSPRSGYVKTVFKRTSGLYKCHRTIVSIPVDLTEDQDLAKFEEKGVKGRYVSVERILELEDGSIEWRMATSSTPGGSIPSFFVEKSMDGKIAEVSNPDYRWTAADSRQDVPHFMKWLHSLPKE